MRVLIVSHLFPTASSPSKGMFVRLQAEALSRIVECKIVSASYDSCKPEPPSDLDLDVKYLPLPWGPAGAPSTLKLLRASRVYRKSFAQLLRGHWKPDIIHAHYAFPDAVVAIQCGSEMNIPVIATLHGTDVNVQLQRRFSGRWIASKLKGANRLILVSDHMIDSLRTVDVDLSSEVTVVPNGYEPDLCPKESVYQRRGLLFVGSLIPVKNVDVLIRAYASVADRLKSNLTIVGGGGLRPALENLAVVCGVSDKITFNGELPHAETIQAISRARTLVLPSKREGLPTVVVEALACGTPVIGARVGGIPGLIESRERGILVSPGDVEALAAALVEADKREWGHAAILASPGVLTWREVATRLLDVYTDVLEEVEPKCTPGR